MIVDALAYFDLKKYSTVKDVTTIQHKINIFGVTKAYYLSFLNF